MSWSGFPNAIRLSIIRKRKEKYVNTSSNNYPSVLNNPLRLKLLQSLAKESVLRQARGVLGEPLV